MPQAAIRASGGIVRSAAHEALVALAGGGLAPRCRGAFLAWPAPLPAGYSQRWPARPARAGRTRRIPDAGGGLRRMPHRARRPGLCGRPRLRVAVRHDLLTQHHAGHADRHRRVERRRLCARVHSGIGRHGENLYPAFPYTAYARTTTDDVLAIRAYLATVPPVSAKSPPNRVAFPFNQRYGLRLWNALFLPSATFQANPTRDAAWNRGAYLADALGHCGECHTPRNALMGLDEARKVCWRRTGWLAGLQSDRRLGPRPRWLVGYAVAAISRHRAGGGPRPSLGADGRSGREQPALSHPDGYQRDRPLSPRRAGPLRWPRDRRHRTTGGGIEAAGRRCS